MVGILPMAVANSVFGALLIATCLTALSLGVAYAQYYDYMKASYNEHPFFKWTMAVLMLISTLHVALVIHIVYYYLVQEYGNPGSLMHVIWSITVNNILMELVNFIIRLLLARRIWFLSEKNLWVTVLAVLSSTGTFALAAGHAVILQQIPDVSLLTNKSAGGIYKSFRRLVWSSFALNIAAEITLTTALCYYLYRARTGFKKTNSLIATFMVYTIHTGLFILIGSAISTIFFLCQPNGIGNYPNIFYYMESSLYINAYLAMLTSRNRIRNTDEVATLPLTQLTRSRIGPTAHEKPGEHFSNCIHVTMNRTIDVDDGSPPSIIGGSKGRSWCAHGNDKRLG